MQLTEFVDRDVNQFILFHKHLNPKLWNSGHLRLEVRVKLLRVALEFYNFLEVPHLRIVDVIFTGSNAAFNYTKMSDIDIHLLVDFARSSCPTLADNFFTTKKNLWNKTRQVTIRGCNTELYVEDIKHPVKANGVYSLLYGEWSKRPERVAPQFDDSSVLKKTEQFADEIDNLMNSKANSAMIQDFMTRLRTLRQAGLSAGGEFSTENLVFKSLRNLGYIDKLANYRMQAQNAALSLDDS